MEDGAEIIYVTEKKEGLGEICSITHMEVNVCHLTEIWGIVGFQSFHIAISSAYSVRRYVYSASYLCNRVMLYVLPPSK